MLLKKNVKNPSSNRLKEITALHTAVDSLLTKNAEIKIRYAKQNLFEHGNITGRYLSFLTKKKSDSQTISSITDHAGNLTFDSGVIKTLKNFYKSEPPPRAPELMETFSPQLFSSPPSQRSRGPPLMLLYQRQRCSWLSKGYNLVKHRDLMDWVVSSIKSFTIF